MLGRSIPTLGTTNNSTSISTSPIYRRGPSTMSVIKRTSAAPSRDAIQSGPSVNSSAKSAAGRQVSGKRESAAPTLSHRLSVAVVEVFRAGSTGRK
jgi:hypothetical protein